MNRSCVNVTIHEDIFSERPEEISAMLTTANPEVALNQSQGMIVIIDDEGMLFSESIRFLLPYISLYYHVYFHVQMFL